MKPAILTRHIKNGLCMLALSSMLSACGGGSSANSNNTPPDTTTPPVSNEIDYQALIDDAVGNDIPGIILTVQGPGHSFTGAAGLADKASATLMQVYHQMPAGSAGKKATALLVAMLVEDGLLDIDALISTWLPPSLLAQIQYSQDMTLRMLLNHTSGAYDYLDPRTSDQWFSAAIEDLDTIKTDAYALEFALNKPAYFQPGQGFHYSNTGYLLAGLILDTVLGEHHHKELRNRVLIPLGLNDTYYSAIENGLGNPISGYTLFDGDEENTKAFYANIGVADAPLVTTVTDMDNLLRAIITDDTIVTDDMREILLGENTLTQIDGTFYYGMGLFKDTLHGNTIYHHGGDEAGYKTVNFYLEGIDTSVTAFFNCNGYESCITLSDSLVQQVLASLF